MAASSVAAQTPDHSWPVSDYKLSMIDPAFHHEAVELHHASLRMLRTAIELDGKSLPPAAGETQGAVFYVNELNRNPYELLHNSSAQRSLVPRRERFSILGAQCAVTLGQLLPWLTDSSGLPEAERLTTARYLREDVPTVWVHMVPSTQKQALEDLDSILRRIRHEGIRRELETLRAQLRSTTDK